MNDVEADTAMPAMQTTRTRFPKTMGETMHASFVRYKTDEWERYHQTVTDLEVEEYLRLY